MSQIIPGCQSGDKKSAPVMSYQSFEYSSVARWLDEVAHDANGENPPSDQHEIPNNAAVVLSPEAEDHFCASGDKFNHGCEGVRLLEGFGRSG